MLDKFEYFIHENSIRWNKATLDEQGKNGKELVSVVLYRDEYNCPVYHYIFKKKIEEVSKQKYRPLM